MNRIKWAPWSKRINTRKNSEVTLMNFRVPKELKEEFQYLCKVNQTPMTKELVTFMKAFIWSKKAELNRLR